MFSGYVIIFGMAIFASALVSTRAQDLAVNESEDRSFASKALEKLAKKALLQAFGGPLGGAAAGCIEQAIEQCKHELKHLKKMLKCAGNYFKEDKGECLIP
ncbi:hypothetical protein TKK_0015970 [Trichogramma kaykai]|uniref:Uncharacterized protein n=1 Tax=Trichogramma kaykai TaxID=54128 RepID=A0ABD2W8N0_9HYME